MTWAAIGVLLVLVPACSGLLPVCWGKECIFPSFMCHGYSEDCKSPTYGITKYGFSATREKVTWNTYISGRSATSKTLRLCVFRSFVCALLFNSTCFHVICESAPESPSVISFENYSTPRLHGYMKDRGVDPNAALLIEYVCVQREAQLSENTTRDQLLYDQCVTTAGTRPVIGNLFSATSGDQEPHLRWNSRERVWE